MVIVLFVPAALTGIAAVLIWLGLRNPQKVRWIALASALVLLACACIPVMNTASIGGLGGVFSFIVAILSAGTAVLASVLLLIRLPGRHKLFVGVLLLLFPVALLLSFQAGDAASPKVKIRSDGEIVVQALHTYHIAYGHYPVTLAELVPRFLSDLKQPETVWGWLYQTEEQEFSLGYVWDVDRWGYSVCVYDLEVSKWDCLDYSTGPFGNLPVTPAPTFQTPP